MGDITDKRLLYFKGALFLALGIMAVGLILFEHGDLRLAFLLAIAIWSFCRAYYFAFYVIQHYADPNFRFAGLGSFVSYLSRQRCKDRHVSSLTLHKGSSVEARENGQIS